MAIFPRESRAVKGQGHFNEAQPVVSMPLNCIAAECNEIGEPSAPGHSPGEEQLYQCMDLSVHLGERGRGGELATHSTCFSQLMGEMGSGLGLESKPLWNNEGKYMPPRQ